MLEGGTLNSLEFMDPISYAELIPKRPVPLTWGLCIVLPCIVPCCPEIFFRLAGGLYQSNLFYEQLILIQESLS